MSNAQQSRRTLDLSRLLEGLVSEAQRELAGLRTTIRDAQARRAVGDVYDDVSRESEMSISAASADLVTTRLHQARRALTLLRAGRYGTCQECGEPISEARLRALPLAVRCLACQQQTENPAGGRSAIRLSAEAP